MPAPSFIQEAETAWNSSANKTTAGFNVLAGDILTAVGITADNSTTLTISNSGSALTWTPDQATNVGSSTKVYIWTATVDTDRTGLTVTFTRGGGSSNYVGGNVITHRGSDGVGASSSVAAVTGAPSLALTTTQDNSAIVVANGDWNALDGASRTWRTVNGSGPTEQTYFRDSSMYTVYIGCHADAGTAGAQTVGLSAPSGQKYSIAAVEIKGTAGGAPTVVRMLGTLGVGK